MPIQALKIDAGEPSGMPDGVAVDRGCNGSLFQTCSASLALLWLGN